MYGVFSWKCALMGVVTLLLSLFVLLGIAANTIHTQAQKRELPIYSVAVNEKKAAVGINCAWDDSELSRLLEILKAHEVKATFFIVGDWCDRYPQAVKQIAKEGHEIGSHSDTHPDMTKLSREQIIAQLDRSKQKLEQVSEQKVSLFRPPSGAYNNLTIETARELGWEVIQWSNDSIDWKTPPVEEMVSRVCKKAAPGDIMLFHLGKKNTPLAMEKILDELCAQGYEFVPVGELILPAPYRLDHTGRQYPAD